VVVTKAALKRPEGVGLLLEIILSGWRHGRRSPQLLGVVWPDVWNEPTAEVRKRLGVSPYQSPFPPDLVEQLERASA
jgi:ubiquinone biosynthesis protein Coq4